MKKYEKPMVLAAEELAEGVYAASGAGNANCVSTDPQIMSIDGQGIHRIRVPYRHDAWNEHCNTGFEVTIFFDVPFEVLDSNGYHVMNDGTTAITIVVANALHSDGDCNSEFNIVGKAVNGGIASITGHSETDEGYRNFECEHVGK